MRYFLELDTLKLPEEEAEVVICGSGIAGLTTAIVLKELGVDPLILTRGVGNTFYSQGGIASAVHPADSPLSHFIDTFTAGRLMSNEEALRILVEEGVFRIVDLERWGVSFDRRGEVYETTLEGGHTFPRVLKVKDYTGREIFEKLFNRAEALNIKVEKGELQEILGEDRVEGIVYEKEGRLVLLRAKAVVLATGGAASTYLYTSNSSKVRGDGIGIAVRAGAVLKNPEFVQFHPTVLENTNFLISEAVRGEGALLIDEKGKRFVDELKPRDVVARSIYRKLKEGGRVFLDMRPVARRGIKLEERFPTIFSFLKERGYDPYKEPVPVVPASHYYIGGIEVDTFGRTALEGLYAVGECACTGVHGANRLASNSLLEGVVFGYRTAYRIKLDLSFLKKGYGNVKVRRDHRIKEPSFDFTSLKTLMWEKVGLERDGEELKEAINRLILWLEEMSFAEPTKENRQLTDLTLVALATAMGALRREESRGVHYRADFPYEREIFRRDTVINLSEEIRF